MATVIEQSEQGELLAETRRIDRLLTQQQLKLTRRFRRVPCEMIVHISEHRASLHGKRPQYAGPQLELVSAVDLNTGVVDDRAVRSHPPHVNEIRGRLRSKLHHLLSRNPARIRQGKRDAMLGE